MKKKAILCITTAAAVLIFGTTTALAAYTDGNGDGICDNAAATCPQPQDGTGRQAGLGNAGLGRNFTDGNGDGLCDNAAAACPQPQDGTGRQAGLGQDTARMQRQENGKK